MRNTEVRHPPASTAPGPAPNAPPQLLQLTVCFVRMYLLLIRHTNFSIIMWQVIVGNPK